MTIATLAMPGAAEAVKESGRTDVKVIGVSFAQHEQAPRKCWGNRKCRAVEPGRPWLSDSLMRPAR